MATIDLGVVTAYAYAVAGGYTGSEQDFEELLGNIATDLAEIENLTVTANTLPAGSSATASYSNGALTLGIPKGDKGDKGDTGSTGATGPTGNGIASITLTSTVGAVHTYTITYTNGQTTTFDVTDGEVTTASLTATLADYARIDGYYEDLTAGSAEELISNVGVIDTEAYNFRPAGGSAEIGNRAYNTWVGGSLAVNQLVNTGATSVTVQNGHKYFSNINNVKTIGASTGSAISINDASKDNVTDLTLLFGTTIADYIYTLETGQAGAGVAWFKNYFPNQYYPYNAGGLEHVTIEEYKTNELNQWDEEWEVGKYDNTGAKITSTTQIRCKNAIKVLPNTNYYVFIPSTTTTNGYFAVYYYDDDGNFISALTTGASTKSNGQIITTPSGCFQMRFFVTASYGTTYNNDICISLYYDDEYVGVYEPFKEHVYPLDESIVLRGIPKQTDDGRLEFDGDTWEDNGTITRRYGEVDLGSLTWVKSGSLFAADSPANTPASTANGMENAICSKYLNAYGQQVSFNSGSIDKAFMINTSYVWGGKILVCDSAYSTASDFKTAMNGVMLTYELATPTTEQAPSFTSPQIVHNIGTEELIGSAIPVGHSTKYLMNIKAMVEASPQSPTTDGDYIMRRQNGQNMYVALASTSTIQDIISRLEALEA